MQHGLNFSIALLYITFFKDTAYTFLGFTLIEDSLFVVLKQPFIKSDSPVDLSDVKRLLAFNGFENTRRNDYYNKELGLILEDMHDENIISNSNKLFFIDTVFYTVDPINYKSESTN